MRNRMIRWVIAMLLMCVLSHTAAFAYGYNQSAQSKSWGYQSTYQPTYQSTYQPTYQSTPQKTFDPNAAEPTFRFRTTSTYITTSSDAGSDLFSGFSGPRRASMWDDIGEDDPVGVVPDPVPVGDTPWWLMLLLVAGYIAFRSFRQRKA